MIKKNVLLLCCSVLLTACGSVYKEHAGKVFDAKQSFVEALNKSHLQLAKSIDARKLAAIAAKPELCKVTEYSQLPFYMLRPQTVIPYIKDIPSIANEEDCLALLVCTPGNKNCDGSKIICLSDAQRVCVISAIAYTTDKAKKDELTAIISSGSVPGTRIRAQQYVADGIEVMTQYVALLGILSKPNKSEVEDISASLIKNLSKLKENLKKINADDAAKDLGVTTDELKSYLDPVTDLLSTVEVISKDWNDKNEIVKHVKKGSGEFTKTLDSILPFTETDEKLNALAEDSNNFYYRSQLMKKLSSESESQKRSILLEKLVTFNGSNAKLRLSAVSSAGATLKESHHRLILLITDPDEAQRESIFKAVLSNLASVFKKLSLVVAFF